VILPDRKGPQNSTAAIQSRHCAFRLPYTSSSGQCCNLELLQINLL
jgi:hypothetical protein